jgi:hypothetical protein
VPAIRRSRVIHAVSATDTTPKPRWTGSIFPDSATHNNASAPIRRMVRDVDWAVIPAASYTASSLPVLAAEDDRSVLHGHDATSASRRRLVVRHDDDGRAPLPVQSPDEVEHLVAGP